jgi:hypothetical protein
MDEVYYKSFHKEDTEGYINFFNEYGFVVIDDVLFPEDCELSTEEVWRYLEEKGEDFDRNDWKTWDNWPESICRNGGFMGRFPYWMRMKNSSLKETHISCQPMAWKNRQNPLIYEAFSNILKSEKLWVSIDRYGIMRPTKIVEGGIEILREEWKTKENWLHWDLSPFHYGTSAAGYAPREMTYDDIQKEYGSLRVQGLVTITDCPVEVGGFHCVPKFCGDRFYKWRNENLEYGNREENKRNFIEVPENDPMRNEITPVPMRAGSLLIWNSQLPHGNFPNSSSKFRIVQYIKMISSEDPREFSPVLGKFSPEAILPPDFEPTELGKKLFGLLPWQ